MSFHSPPAVSQNSPRISTPRIPPPITVVWFLPIPTAVLEIDGAGTRSNLGHLLVHPPGFPGVPAEVQRGHATCRKAALDSKTSSHSLTLTHVIDKFNEQKLFVE